MNLTITNLEKLKQWFSDTKANYWKAYDSDRNGMERKTVGSNFDVENSETDEAMRRFESFLELYMPNGGRFYIWAVDKPTNTKGGFYTWFRLESQKVKGEDYSLNSDERTKLNVLTVIDNKDELLSFDWINKQIKKGLTVTHLSIKKGDVKIILTSNQIN